VALFEGVQGDLVDDQHIGGLLRGGQRRWADDGDSGDGDRTRVTLEEIADGVGDGEDPDSRHQRVGLALVEGADGRPDLAVSFVPEAAAVTEY
jgi:hypothetical protein